MKLRPRGLAKMETTGLDVATNRQREDVARARVDLGHSRSLEESLRRQGDTVARFRGYRDVAGIDPATETIINDPLTARAQRDWGSSVTTRGWAARGQREVRTSSNSCVSFSHPVRIAESATGTPDNSHIFAAFGLEEDIRASAAPSRQRLNGSRRPGHDTPFHRTGQVKASMLRLYIGDAAGTNLTPIEDERIGHMTRPGQAAVRGFMHAATLPDLQDALRAGTYIPVAEGNTRGFQEFLGLADNHVLAHGLVVAANPPAHYTVPRRDY